jgi:hypothetical protein
VEDARQAVIRFNLFSGACRFSKAFSGEVDFRFAIENASKQEEVERFPIPKERKPL